MVRHINWQQNISYFCVSAKRGGTRAMRPEARPEWRLAIRGLRVKPITLSQLHFTIVCWQVLCIKKAAYFDFDLFLRLRRSAISCAGMCVVRYEFGYLNCLFASIVIRVECFRPTGNVRPPSVGGSSRRPSPVGRGTCPTRRWRAGCPPGSPASRTRCRETAPRRWCSPSRQPRSCSGSRSSRRGTLRQTDGH